MMNIFGKSLISAVVLLGTAAWSASSFGQTLKVAGHEPWVVHDNDSVASTGLFVEVTNAVANDAGLKVDFQSMVFADLIPALKGGKIDIIATVMAITPERKQQVDFSIPIYDGPTEAVVAQTGDTTPYKDLADLKGVPVGTQKGSIQLALLQKTGGFTEIKTYNTTDEAWAAVASGEVKVAVTAGADTIYAAKKGKIPNLRIVSSYQSPSPKPQIGMAVRKDSGALLTKINGSLAKLERNGVIKMIFNKYGFEDWAPPR